MLRRLIFVGALAGSTALVATPAEARCHHHHGYHWCDAYPRLSYGYSPYSYGYSYPSYSYSPYGYTYPSYGYPSYGYAYGYPYANGQRDYYYNHRRHERDDDDDDE